MLKQRAAKLEAPIQMCDALSRNSPKLIDTLLANCLAHGRRQFTEVADSFPDECRHVLESLGAVYGFDADARKRCLTAEERLTFHQTHSAPVMEDLRQSIETQFAEHKTEPNSGLGTAAAALEHGLPQIAIPRVFAQSSNAEWLRRLGVCVIAPPAEWTVDGGTTLVKRMLSDAAIRRRAESMASRVDRRALLDTACRFLLNCERSAVRGYTGSDDK
ncbi:MAG: transposase [Acidobacteriota bacterium]|nr:transposase [Acidobacteriota bacterium]